MLHLKNIVRNWPVLAELPVVVSPSARSPKHFGPSVAFYWLSEATFLQEPLLAQHSMFERCTVVVLDDPHSNHDIFESRQAFVSQVVILSPPVFAGFDVDFAGWSSAATFSQGAPGHLSSSPDIATSKSFSTSDFARSKFNVLVRPKTSSHEKPLDLIAVRSALVFSKSTMRSAMSSSIRSRSGLTVIEVCMGLCVLHNKRRRLESPGTTA